MKTDTSAMEVDSGVPLCLSQRPLSTKERVLEVVKQRLPAAEWLPRYCREDALGDAVAGVTLGLTLVPQSIAYASLAGVPVQHGLYSALAGGLLYAPLGTVRQVSIGPTSLMALLTLQFCHRLPLAYVHLLAFLSGVVVFIMGLLRLGFLVDLVSPAVTGGFTSGTALIIVVAQFKGLVGLSFLAESIPENLVLVVNHISDIRVYDCALSVACCCILLAFRKLKDVKVSEKRRVLKKALWLTSISRNALVVGGAAFLAYLTRADDGPHPLFKLSGRVKSGLPSLTWPAPAAFPAPTGDGTISLLDATRELGGSLALTPIVMVLANIAIAKAFARGRVDATQEMVALGLCNAGAACLGAMPTCGAFTRSAVSHASGVRTPLAGLYSGLITLLALVFLTEYFCFIPRASLSSVLICAVIFMVDVSEPRQYWQRGSRLEACTWCATLAASLALGVEAALVLGAVLSLGGLLRRLAATKHEPTLHKSPLGGVVVVHAPPALVYVNASRWACDVIAAAAAARPAARALAIDCSALALLDDAASQELELMTKQLSSSGVRVCAFNARLPVLPRLTRAAGVSPAAARAASLPAALAELDAPATVPAAATAAAGDDDVPLITLGAQHDTKQP